MQFDYIGIQTLFDRYLIHETDTVTSKRQRLEAPQVFWLRVAMGLAIIENDREARAAEFYSVYKSRRACSSIRASHTMARGRSYSRSSRMVRVVMIFTVCPTTDVGPRASGRFPYAQRMILMNATAA